MLKTIDVGLMANHLSAHKGIIKRLELYANTTKHQQLLNIFVQQISAMTNHVQVMNMLLDPNYANYQITLPPIPQSNLQVNNQLSSDLGIEDKDMLFDAHFTATAMANDNFISATNMKSTQVKKLHLEMALQQDQLARKHELLAEKMGWMNPPTATNAEQQQAMTSVSNQNMNPYFIANQRPGTSQNYSGFNQ